MLLSIYISLRKTLQPDCYSDVQGERMLTQNSDRFFMRRVVARLCTFSAGSVFLLLAACGLPDNDSGSQWASDFQKTYGIRYDVPLKCGGPSAQQIIDVTLESAQKLSDFCEIQNVRAAQAGFLRCPVGLCQQEYQPGSLAAPTLKFVVNNGTSMSGMFGGYGGGSSDSSSGSGSGASAIFGKRIYVTMEFNIPLAKNPDQLSCVNPLNSTVQTTILTEIGKAALAAKNDPCAPVQ